MSLRDRLQEIDLQELDAQQMRAATLPQWIDDIKRLYEFVRTQLSELLPDEKITIVPVSVRRYEELLGEYLTDELNVSLRGRTIVFSPVARIVLGSSGRVDMFLRGRIDEAYKLLRDQILSPAVWRLAKGQRRKALQDLPILTKETLESAIEDLLG
jgi:hypothetical protein